jgi:dTDP-L-rhamnose 4-epimerase
MTPSVKKCDKEITLSKTVLITGGAGFIGSHTANELLSHGYHVRVLDNLCAQVHGPQQARPSYLSSDVELIVGDVRDPEAVKGALKGADAVYHFAAAVGVGQSMYQIAHYTDTNNMGTATLLQELIDHPVERLIVASSMSIYGEGLYEAPDGAVVEGIERPIDQLKDANWELMDERGETLQPVPTPETKTPNLSSVYALSKYDQERLQDSDGRAALFQRLRNTPGALQSVYRRPRDFCVAAAERQSADDL